MKRWVLSAIAASVSFVANATDVGVSIAVGEPGFYGRIDIGNYPRPELVYAQPVIIQPAAVARSPVYLHVPPGHAKDWGKHCHKYGACGERVFFVQENWYNGVYVPQYRVQHGKPHKNGHPGKGKGKN